MQLPWLIRFIFTLLILLFSANFPFIGLGMFWGAPAILLMSFWLSSTWNWYDSALFIALKTWFLGGFCIALVEILRQYPIMESDGPQAYLSKLHLSILFALIPLTFASFFMAFFHKIFHIIDYVSRQIDGWIHKEQLRYRKTWMYRRYSKAMKYVRGFAWRIHNQIIKCQNYFKKEPKD